MSTTRRAFFGSLFRTAAAVCALHYATPKLRVIEGAPPPAASDVGILRVYDAGGLKLATLRFDQPAYQGSMRATGQADHFGEPASAEFTPPAGDRDPIQIQVEWTNRTVCPGDDVHAEVSITGVQSSQP